MSIENKVESAKTGLKTVFQLVRFCVEHTKFIDLTAKSLFEKISVREDLSEEQKENEIDIATVGILVSALSAHLSRYKGIKNKEDKSSPYLWDENGYLKSPYYAKQYKEVLAISGISESDEEDNETADAYNERLVLSVGTKVMNGELPFQPEILNTIFDKHTQDARDQLDTMCESCDTLAPGKAEEIKQDFSNNITALKALVNAIAMKINQIPSHFYTSAILSEAANRTFYTIEAIFNRALNTAIIGNDTPEKKKFVEGLVALKRETLAGFQKGDKNFGFDDCETIANSAFTLAAKVSSNTVAQADVDQFKQATQKYRARTSTLAMAISLILNAVICMIVGAAIGFVVGSVPGAITGGAIGVGVGVGRGLASCSMWYKKEPLNKMASAATEMVPSLTV